MVTRPAQRSSLRRHHDLGTIRLQAEAGATQEDLFDIFTTYPDQVAIFHYGGHAGGAQLHLETAAGNAAAGAAGLAPLLGQQQGLKCVFLNGCATLPQVELLLQSGVPAVIATSVEIDDQMATEFAEQFYNALAGHVTIGRAFQVASSFVRTKYQAFPSIGMHRGLALRSESQRGALPWGLYLGEQGEEAAEWTIPRQAVRPQHVLRNRFDYATRPDVNDLLIDIICEDIARYNPDLDHELNKADLYIPAIKREIIDSFPTPIGEQLRKLFTRSPDPSAPDPMEWFSAERLKQLVQAYRTTMQLICFAELSQLWDEKHQGTGMEIGEDHIVDFNSFFALDKDNYLTYDYVRLIRTIGELFNENQIPHFIDELHRIRLEEREDNAFHGACTFLTSLQQQLLSREATVPPAGQLEALCLEAEQQLAIVLRDLAFLVQYKLATIKNIELVKPRHAPPRYRHHQIVLNRALTVASIGSAEVGVEFRNFTDNKCVLFLKTGDGEVLGYLNLTPFLIDENALNSDYSSKLYLYAFQQTGGCYYQFLNNYQDPFLRIDQEHYPDIREQFDRFKADIFGTTYQPGHGQPVLAGASRFARKHS